MESILDADLVLLDGNIICVDPAKTTAQAVAAKNGQIIAVGSDEDISSLVGRKTEVIRLAGRSVIPGFIDAHCHVEWYGRDKRGVDLMSCKNGEEALNLIKRRVEQSKPGEWVIIGGGERLALGIIEYFSREKVDPFSPKNPVYWNMVHRLFMNGAALEACNITKDSQPDGVRGGTIETDANGEFTGWFGASKTADPPGWALRHAKQIMYPPKDYAKLLEEGIEDWLKVGITTAHSAWEDPYTLRAFQTLEDSGRLRMRSFITLAMDEYSDAFIKTGMHTGFGSDMLKLQSFKVMLGMLGYPGHEAALFEDYASMPGNRGYFMYPPEWVKEKVLQAVKNDWSVHTHVCGDRDMNMILTAYEKALKWYKEETGKDNTGIRLSVAHCYLFGPGDLERAVDLKLVVNVNPITKLMPYFQVGGQREKAVGYERWRGLIPVKTMVDAGLTLSIGCDYPLGPIDPMAGLYGAISGGVHPWEAVTPYQALQMYTINGAYLLFSEGKIGSIEEGKLADLVVLSGNPLTMPKENIWDVSNSKPKDLVVDYTVLGGNVVYSRKEGTM